MSHIKKILLSLMVVGIMAAIVDAGTFATFNAQVSNPTNQFATGTLVLSDTKQGGTGTCFSTAGGSTDSNANAACEQLLNLTVKKPGDSGTANLTIKNEGTLAASVLKVFMTALANANASGESYFGTGTPSTKVQLYIQQFSDSGFTTKSACLYGGATGNTCDFSDTAKTLAAFEGTYSSSGNGLTIGSGLAAGASSYFQIGVKLPDDANNSYQGRQSTFTLSWYAEQ